MNGNYLALIAHPLMPAVRGCGFNGHSVLDAPWQDAFLVVVALTTKHFNTREAHHASVDTLFPKEFLRIQSNVNLRTR